MSNGSRALVVLAAAVIVAGGLVLWGDRLFKPSPTLPGPAAPASSQAPAPVASAQPPAPALELPAPAAPLAPGQVADALVELLGRKAVSSFVQTQDFPRRLVATVDNLGRSQASTALWPVNPTPGRFAVEQRDGDPVIAADNAARYTPFVLLAESVDAGRAADLYVRMQPLLQRAYEELGYPRQRFNDRLLAVIDLLLATPTVEYPVKLHLPEIKGPVQSERPWVRYEYADPALESLSAGQKILLRSGPVNARRLKAKLAEFRAELTRRAAKR